MHFYALPAWALEPAPRGKAPPPADPLVPAVQEEPEVVGLALQGAEFAGERALSRARAALERGGSKAVYARPPDELPALLRLADELLRLAKQQAGEPARVYLCACGTRYVVPSSVVGPSTLRCERCGRDVALEAPRSVGLDHIVDPATARVNSCRRALSEFFREAMARGWPVLVKQA